MLKTEIKQVVEQQIYRWLNDADFDQFYVDDTKVSIKLYNPGVALVLIDDRESFQFDFNPESADIDEFITKISDCVPFHAPNFAIAVVKKNNAVVKEPAANEYEERVRVLRLEGMSAAEARRIALAEHRTLKQAAAEEERKNKRIQQAELRTFQHAVAEDNRKNTRIQQADYRQKQANARIGISIARLALSLFKKSQY